MTMALIGIIAALCVHATPCSELQYPTTTIQNACIALCDWNTKYLSHPPTATTDAVCTRLSTCPITVAMPPTPSSDRTCFTYPPGFGVSGKVHVGALLSPSASDVMPYAAIIGDVQLVSTAAFTPPVLQYMSGSLITHGAPALTLIAAPALRYIGGFFGFDGASGGNQNNTALTCISFPRLEVVMGLFEVYNSNNTYNAALTAIDLSALWYIGGFIYIEQNSALISFSLPMLTYVGLNLNVIGNAVMTSLSAPLLTFISHWLAVDSNQLLDTISMPNLSTIAGSCLVCNGGTMWSVFLCGNAPQLSYSAAIAYAAAGKTCFLDTDCQLSTTCPANPCLISDMLIHYFYLLFSRSGASATVCGVVQSAGNTTNCASAASLSVLATVYSSFTSPCLTFVASNLFVNGVMSFNTILAVVALPRLTYTGGLLHIGNSGFSGAQNLVLTYIDLRSLAYAGGGVQIDVSTALMSLYLGALTYSGQAFRVYTNAALESLNVTALAYIGQYLEIHDVSISSLSLPALTLVGQHVYIAYNAACTWLSVPTLAFVGLHLEVSNHNMLTSVYIPSLTTIGGDYLVTSNTALDSVDFHVLASIGGCLSVFNNSALASVHMPSLRLVTACLSVAHCTALTSLELPSLLTVGQYIDIHGNTALTWLWLPGLSYVGAYIAINTNPLLATITAPALVDVACLHGACNDTGAVNMCYNWAICRTQATC